MKILLSLLLMVGGTFAIGSAALAAPPYDTNGTITDLKFIESSHQSGSEAQLTANWSFPDNPATPAGFTIDLPPQMPGRGDTFVLRARDTNEPIGTCVATATQLQCDLDTAYVTANPVGLNGDVYFWVKVNDSVTETTEKTYAFGEHNITTTITPPSQECTVNCPWQWDLRKDGVTQYTEGGIMWFIHIASERGGAQAGNTVTVTDTPGEFLETVSDGEYPMLTSTTQTGVYGGAERPVNFVTVPRSEYTVNPDNSITFVTKAGHYYEIRYMTLLTDGGEAELYSNKVEVSVNGTKVGETGGQARWAGGGGSGIGTDVGVFTITKDVTGDAVIDPDRVYSGTYTVTQPNGTVNRGIFQVKDGATWRSPQYPRDSVVAITENPQNGPGSVRWSSPDFSTNNFPLPGGEVTPVTLTNEATVPTAPFSAHKALVGADAATALVPADATFTLEYSYPAGPGFAAGSGELVLGKDGTSVTSPQLPAGAVVALAEKTPAAVPGAAWGPSTISPTSVTIAESGSNGPVEVTVENPIRVTTGSFSIEKSLSGPGAVLVPEGTEFVVDWAYPAGDGYAAGSGSVTVVAGAPAVQVDDIPEGAVVTLTEGSPAEVDGMTWLDPIFSENGITIVAGQTYAIDLDNPTALKTGTFSVVKTVEGDAADRVNDDTEFRVDYTYPAGTAHEAGAGFLVVKGDGVPVESPALPYGAELTLTEAKPAEIADAVWEDASFSADTVTIGDGTLVEISLVNTINDIPETPIEPEPTPPTETTPPVETTPPAETPPSETQPPADTPPGTPALPETGSPVGPLAVLTALTLLLAGSLTVLYGRRRTGTHS